MTSTGPVPRPFNPSIPNANILAPNGTIDAAKVQENFRQLDRGFYGPGPTGVGVIGVNQIQTATQTTVEFRNIARNYRHLRLVCSCRTDGAIGVGDLYVRFNNDSGAASYTSEITQSIGGAPTNGTLFANQPQLRIGLVSDSAAAAGFVGTSDTMIYDYRGTTFTKQVTGISGSVSGLNFYNESFWGYWVGTAAITNILIFAQAGGFIAGSVFSLYGMA